MGVPYEWGVNICYGLFGVIAWMRIIAKPNLQTAADWTVRVGAAGVALVAVTLAVGLVPDVFWYIRMTAWLVFFWLPVHVGVVSLALARPHPRIALGAGGVALAIGAVSVDAFWIEPTAIEVTRAEIGSPKVTAPVEILVVSDFQTDRYGPYEQRVMDLVAQARPDLILWPGDFVQLGPGPERTAVAARFTEAVARIPRPPLGSYAVDGNMEIGHPGWAQLFGGTSVTALTQRTSIAAGELTITGLPFSEGFDTTQRVPRQPGFHVVFAHGPDFALGTIDADLLVAGHTHGGQVQIPFLGPVITFSEVPRAWASGWTRLASGARLFVSRGIGHERHMAPRMRFNCRPELAFITVVPAQE